MPIDFSLVDLKQKIQTVFQKVGKLVTSKPSAHQQVDLQHNENDLPILNNLPQTLSHLRQIFRKYLPVIIIILVLIFGLLIGKKIASVSNQSIDIPKPTLPTITPTPSSDSSLTPLKQSIEQFNPQLPDPIMPEFDDSITLQELED